jgi:curved DNA-binding protein CbpA
MAETTHSPHEVLGVSEDDDDERVRRRYLELVREKPPDRFPEEFARIRAAYDELRDPLKLMEKKLFRIETEEAVADIEAELRKRLTETRLSVDALLSLASEP